MSELPPRSSRTTSKLMLWSTMILAWALLFYAVSQSQGEGLAPWVVLLMVAVGGGYMGTGHLDYRLVSRMIMSRYGAAAVIPEATSAAVEAVKNATEDPDDIGIVR